MTSRGDDWQRGDWMQTFTGRAFYPTDPRVDDICIEDIGHALSLICRYGGHVKRFYSVAEHCLLMSDAVVPEHALWALLHDATEAYLGDMVRPLKLQMPAYVAIENRLMSVLCEKYGLAPGPMPAAVKEADNRILLTERAALLGSAPRSWVVDDLAPLPVTIHGWPPAQAEGQYLARFAELSA